MLRLLICFAPLLLLAQNEDLPDGEGKETFVKMCSNCHALKRVTKVRFPRKYWETTADDMVSRGAEGSDEEKEIVISYLTRNFGMPLDINIATVKQIQEGLSFSAKVSALIVKQRTDNGPFKSMEDLQKVEGIDPKLLDEQKKNIRF